MEGDKIRIVEKKTCIALHRGNEVIATLAGPDAIDNAESIVLALSAQLPIGWKPVPIIPTRQMINAYSGAARTGDEDEEGILAYQAMVAAAPTILEVEE